MLPLLSDKIHVTEIEVKGLSVVLVENEKGAVNWATGGLLNPPPKSHLKRNRYREKENWN